jgi:hypothetical protein
MSKFLGSATFDGGVTVAMYDGRMPQATVYKTQKGDCEERRRSDVLETHEFDSRAEMREFVAGFVPAED